MCTCQASIGDPQQIQLDVCLGEGMSPDEFCRDVVCPSAAAGISTETPICVECDFEDATEPVEAAECEGECEREVCDVQFADGEVDVPNIETCTTLVDEQDSCANLPGGETTLCRPEPGADNPDDENGDALTLATPRKSGLLRHFLEPRTSLEFSRRSIADIEVGDASRRVAVRGTGELIGQPCPNQSCLLRLSLNLRGPSSFDLDGYEVSDTTIFGGSGRHEIQLNSAGIGTLNRGKVAGTFIGTIEGHKTGFIDSNKAPITVEVDWNAGTVHLFDGFSIPKDGDRPRIGVRLDLLGDMLNRPPNADAGPDQIVECTSPSGASVPLDASRSRDLDDNIEFFSWRTGPGSTTARSEVTTVGAGTDVTQPVSTTVPLGKTTYALSLADAAFQIDSDTTTVHVVDTTPPDIEEFVYDGPSCLWPPNHKYAVLRVDREFRAMLTDACDPNPWLRLDQVTSDQPDDAVGDGHTTDDIVVFPDRVCIRGERQGGDAAGRHYRVHLVAKDASGNENDPVVDIVVPHDARSSQRCDEIEAVEVVSDGDPECDPAAAREAWERLAEEEASTDSGGVGEVDQRDDPVAADSPDTVGCSAAESSSRASTTLALLLVLAGIGLAVLRRRVDQRG